MQDNTSNLNVKVTLQKEALQQIIDNNLPDPLIKDLSPPEAKGIIINVRKNGKVDIEATGNTFRYAIPLQIHTFKSMMLGNVDVTFEVVVQMESQFIIGDDWELMTRTELKDYKWIEKPQLDLGFFKFPLDSIIEEVLENNKSTICKTIDQQVMQRLDIRTPLNNILTQLPNPLVILDTEKIWWECESIKTKIAPFSTDSKYINVTVGAQVPFYFSYGKALEKTNTNLQAPDITLDLDQQSTLRTSCYIDFKTLEKAATTFLQKPASQGGWKEFDIKGQKIKIKNVQINGEGKKLKITAKTEGSFDGTIQVAAQPVFDASSQEIQLKNPELDLQGDNPKSKMVSLVAEKAIETRMSEFLNFPIQKGIDLLNEKIASNNVPPNFLIKGMVTAVDIPEFEIEKEGLKLGIVADCFGELIMKESKKPIA